MVPVSRELQAGTSWPRNVSRSGGLTCFLRIVPTSDNPALSPEDLGAESCGTGSVPGWALSFSWVVCFFVVVLLESVCLKSRILILILSQIFKRQIFSPVL